MDLKFSINVDELAKQLKADLEELNQQLHEAVAGLAVQTHAKVVELASHNLHSTRDLYLDNLSWFPLSDNIWVVVLHEPAMWVEEGKMPGSMVPDLLKNNAKTSKEGQLYKAIPFSHGQPESRIPVAQQSLEATLRSELKKKKIPLKKIETNPDGSPKLGLLHKFDIQSEQVSQHTGIPYLYGVRIYQKQGVREKVQRTIMTFRTVSSKHLGTDKWYHPGTDPKHLMDKAMDWARITWENDILPLLTGSR